MEINKKIILFGAGLYGRRALLHYGDKRVYCFADNFKAGQTLCGKPIISFDELLRIHNDYEVIIALSYDNTREIKAKLQKNGIPVKMFQDIASYEDFESLPEIAKFKDCHKGKRCFIIGNGPSLCAKDLDELYRNNEITFGCNRIYKIYPYTKWRPDYYAVSDYFILVADYENVSRIEAKVKFFPRLDMLLLKSSVKLSDNDIRNMQEDLSLKSNDVYFYNIIRLDRKLSFSADPSKAAYICGGTIVYYHIQLAAYMGFSEMYLLGIDNTTANPVDMEVYLSKKRHFYLETNEDFEKGTEYYAKSKDTEQLSLERRNKGFAFAELYSRSNGFRIFNATRGGQLEAFERIDFSTLFGGLDIK